MWSGRWSTQSYSRYLSFYLENNILRRCSAYLFSLQRHRQKPRPPHQLLQPSHSLQRTQKQRRTQYLVFHLWQVCARRKNYSCRNCHQRNSQKRTITAYRTRSQRSLQTSWSLIDIMLKSTSESCQMRTSLHSRHQTTQLHFRMAFQIACSYSARHGLSRQQVQSQGRLLIPHLSHSLLQLERIVHHHWQMPASHKHPNHSPDLQHHNYESWEIKRSAHRTPQKEKQIYRRQKDRTRSLYKSLSQAQRKSKDSKENSLQKISRLGKRSVHWQQKITRTNRRRTHLQKSKRSHLNPFLQRPVHPPPTSLQIQPRVHHSRPKSHHKWAETRGKSQRNLLLIFISTIF